MMKLEPPTVIPIDDSSHIGHSRRAAVRLAEGNDFDETRSATVGIIATELSTNLLRHAQRGELRVQHCETSHGFAIELVAIDRGPGMDVHRCLEDGYSTGGTAGQGLGAVRRLAGQFDAYSDGRGTVVFARVYAKPPDRIPGAANHRLDWGCSTEVAPGETVCGDGWLARCTGDTATFIVVDGLGHGPAANEAACAALACFDDGGATTPAAYLERAHRSIRGTRGAAAAIAQIHLPSNQMTYAGIGNISGTLIQHEQRRGLMTHNGTVGAQIRKAQQLQYPWSPESMLLMHSDGLQGRWSLDTYPGLNARHPSTIAGILARDFIRGRDDSTVLVAKVWSGS